MVRRDHQALSFRRIRRMPARRNSVIMNNGKIISQRRIILSSLLRIVVGYLFLSTLFANIAQNDDVINIFYDVLALEFVESIDDHSFALAKRGKKKCTFDMFIFR